MLDEKVYNVKALKKYSKTAFYSSYEGIIPDIDKVWEWLQSEKKVKSKKNSL